MDEKRVLSDVALEEHRRGKSTEASGHHEGASHGLYPSPALWDAK